MVKIKKYTTFFMAMIMVASALVVMMPSALSAVDGTAYYTEDRSGTSADYWIDILSSGTAMGATNDFEYVIDYPFTFYGDDYTQLTVSDNGVIMMGSQSYISSSNYDFPSISSYANHVIAPFWDYLNIKTPLEPGAAHSGDYLWGTDFDDDYNPSSDQWLMTPSLDLSGYSAAFLSFWMWYEVSSSYGDVYLEISGDSTGPWTQLDTWASTTAGDEWLEYSYDISAFIGDSSVYVRWRLTSTSSTSTYLGVYIDDVEVVGEVGGVPAVDLVTEDFESWGPYGNNPPTGWTIIDNGNEATPTWNNNDWHRYTYSTWGSNIARVYYSPIENQDEELISPSIDVSAYAGSTVNLAYKTYYNYLSGDYGDVEVSFDGGAWVNVVSYTADTSNPLYEDLTVSVPAGASTMQVRFHYIANNDWYWYIDDFRVYIPRIPGTPTSVLSEDFESGDGGFTHGGAQDEWEYGMFAPIVSDVFYQIFSDKLVVTWYNIQYYTTVSPSTYTFQAILFDDGSIRFNYQEISPYATDSPTVGLNKGDGIDYEEEYYSATGNDPATGDTILYYQEEVLFGVYIDGEIEFDEGQFGLFNGIIAGYGTATAGGYSIDDTLIEPFIDASGGTTLIDTSTDDGFASFELPFDFKFFGVQYYAGMDVYVSSNGYLDFGDPNTDHTDLSNDDIPSITDPDNYAAPFWDDLIIRGADYGGTPAVPAVTAGAANVDPGTTYDNYDYEVLSLTTTITGDLTIAFQTDEETGWDGWNLQVDGTLVNPVGGYDDTSIYGLDSPTTNAPGNTGHDTAPRTQTFPMGAYIGGTHTIDIVFMSDSVVVSGNGVNIYYISMVGGTTWDFSTSLGPWTNTGDGDWGIDLSAPAHPGAPAIPGIDSIICYRVGFAAGHAYVAVEWLNVYDYGQTTNPGTFEVILWDDNTIDFRYLDVNMNSATGCAYGISATVGLENQDGSEGKKYSYNQAVLANGMNIRFYWSDYLGAGYRWLIDGEVAYSGPIWEDPFYDSINVNFPDGPETVTITLEATYDGVPIGSATHDVTVNNLPPEVIIDGPTTSSTYTMGLGTTTNINGDIADVPADVFTMWVEVTPGTLGIDWLFIQTLPISGEEFAFDFIPITPGIYDFTVYTMDDDGDTGMDSIELTVEIPQGALEITDIIVLPEDVQGGGMTIIYVDVFNTLQGSYETGGQMGGATINPGVNYDNNMLETLTLTGYVPGDMEITFQNDIETNYDGWNVQVDGTLVNPVGGYDDTSIIGLDSPYTDAPGNTGHDSAPRTQTFPMPTSWNTVAIVFGSDSSVTYPGPVIDEITIGTTTYDFDATIAPWTGTSGWGLQPYIPGTVIPPVRIPLGEEGLTLELPDGWEMLAMDRPEFIEGQTTETFVTAISIPPGTPIGEYDIDFNIPYVSLDWPGDLGAGDDTEHYIADIGFDFPFYPNAQPSPPPQPGDIWWCGDDALGTYSPNALDSLVFQVTLAAGEQLAIEHDMDGFNTWDGGNLQVWDGTAWQLVYPDSGYMYDDTSIYGLNSPYTGAPGWSDSYGILTSYFDLGPGTHDVRLVFGSTSVVEYRGWLIYSVMAGTTDITDTGVPTNLNPGPSEWHQVAEPPSGGGGGPYGGVYRDITISSNGVIEMGEETSISLTNYGPFPSTSTYADNKIAPFWDDMNTQSGSVSFNSDGNMAVITWYNIARYSNSGTYSFQCILYPNGDIQFNYLTLQEGTTNDSPTVGINLGDGVHGTGYYHDTGTTEEGTRPVEQQSLLFTYDGEQYIATEIPFEWIDFSPRITITVVDKMTANDLAFYRHTQNAMKTIVILYMNLEDGMEDDGSLDSALEDYRNCAIQDAHSTASAANAHGKSYGYWVDEGGMSYFLNPGKNGNGMAGLTGSAAKD